MPRKKPYTEIEIRRIPCERCGKPSYAQWQICADDNHYRGVCELCDVLLNALVLEFFGFENIQELIYYEVEI